MFGPAIDIVRQLISGGQSRSVNEYSVMNLNEFGYGPLGIGLMVTAVVIPLLVTLYCVRNWCCAINRCCSSKENRAPSLTDLAPSKTKRKGSKRFWLPKRSDKDTSKQQRMTSPEDTTCYDIETPTPAGATVEEGEVPLYNKQMPMGLKIYAETD